MINKKDSIRGSLIGGAAGDALGYVIEFASEEQIFKTYGEQGITAYQTDAASGEALISDDTQMTLFTATGVLCARSFEECSRSIERSYFDWLMTQYYSFEQSRSIRVHNSWLYYVPALYSPRAPGSTCLSALLHRLNSKDEVTDFIADKINHSKGCGGVMRVAPVGLYFRNKSPHEAAFMAAQAAAITHSHPFGYLPAAVLAHILHQIIYGSADVSLRDRIQTAMQELLLYFPDEPSAADLNALLQKVLLLADNDRTDLENIHSLGQGWVGEEALCIALYCCLRYENDFSRAVITAVNHSGDSDSTGAIAGYIMGALTGYEAIGPQWKKHLELKDIILEIADDLACPDLTQDKTRSQKYFS